MILISKSDFGSVKLPGLSRNGPLGWREPGGGGGGGEWNVMLLLFDPDPVFHFGGLLLSSFFFLWCFFFGVIPQSPLVTVFLWSMVWKSNSLGPWLRQENTKFLNLNTFNTQNMVAGSGSRMFCSLFKNKRIGQKRYFMGSLGSSWLWANSDRAVFVSRACTFWAGGGGCSSEKFNSTPNRD